MGLRVIKAPLDKPSRTTVRTENTIGPAQVANRFKAFGIIDEILDIDHCEEPDWKARKKSSQHQDKPVGLPFQDNSPESIMSLKAGSLWIAGSCSQNAFNEAFKERFAPFSHVMHEFKKAQI